MPWRCSAYPRPSAWTLRRQRKTEEVAATGSRLVHPREVQRLREKIEDSVDGRRAIALAVCALLLLGTVFSLGVMIGRKAASVQGPPDLVDDLAALDARAFHADVRTKAPAPAPEAAATPAAGAAADRPQGAQKSEPVRIEKPWGYELIWARTDRYVGKILHIGKGHALSLQYHQRKDETLHVLAGTVRLQTGEEGAALEERVLGPGESFHVTPLLRHRMIAQTDCDVLEASTPELDDVVRLEDRYGRAK